MSKFSRSIHKFVQRNYMYIVLLSAIVTIIGFSLAITAESKNRHVKSLENDSTHDFFQVNEIFRLKNEVDTYAITGVLLLFIGFIISSGTQTYILFHTRKKMI